MKRIAFLLLMIGFNGISQEILKADDLQPNSEYDNVHVVRLFGDSLTTSFAIWIKDTVVTHRHDYHSETIYVVEGAGKFYFNDEVRYLEANDVLFIPKKNWHAVKVTSSEPMKVISVQSPGFYGKDRIFRTERE